VAEWLGTSLQNCVQRFESARDLRKNPEHCRGFLFSRAMNRTLVFLLVSLVIVCVDFYAYQGLKAAVQPMSPFWQKTIKGLFWGMTGITLLTILLFEPLSQNPVSRKFLMVMATIGMANVLGKIFFGLWLILDDLIRLLRFVWSKANPEPVSNGDTGILRSQFLAQAGAISAALPLVGMGWGVLSGAHDYRVLKRTIQLPNLPRAFHGITITQISDIHTGSFWNKKAVERGIDLVNSQKSDVIFFTGDLVNNTATELNGWTDLFGTLRADLGVYSVLGNHDYGDYVLWNNPSEKLRNLEDLIQAERQMGWDVLIDENRSLKIGNDYISLIGIQNWGDKGRFPKYGDLKKAASGTQESPVKLLLSHDPSHWRGEVLKSFPDIDVTFSGHTHGMQFGIEVGLLKWSPVKYFYPEWADLYDDNGQYLYVNRGFGYIGYPGRLGILPEITVITLESA
jgi:uncharacterized protein